MYCWIGRRLLCRTPTTPSGSGELRALVLDYFNGARPHLALGIGGRSLRADAVSALARLSRCTCMMA